MDSAIPRRTIMLVDDSEPARELVYWSLGGPSSLFRLIPVSRAREALDLLTEEPVDLIVSDFYMPEMNGEEFMQALASTPDLATIPVIVISADNDPRVERAARDAGAVDFLVKPFSPAALLTAIDEALNRSLSIDRLATGQLTVQTLIESIPHLAMILDEHHRVIMGNKAFFELSQLGVADCAVHCVSIHGEQGEPSNCPLTESALTARQCERIVHDDALGDLVVSVYPLDITTEDGRSLFLHIARSAEDS